jgi:hypothetical protein
MPKKKAGKISYQPSESFDKLNALQELAISQENVSLALKAEELKGKLAGLYHEKKENAALDTSPLKIKVIE